MRPILTHIPLLLLAPSLVVAAANFTQCMYDFQSNPHAIGGVDSRGRLTASPADAVGLTFVACEEYCGRAAETFNFGEFAKLFSSWLLPWLALISELPFGSGNYQDDFISVVMSVGSPALVAYSLALTSLNSRAVYRRAKHIQCKDKTVVAKALICLQQTPLELTKDERLLASISTDSRWAQEIVGRLHQRNVWSIATTVCIAWVIIVYLLAIVGSTLPGTNGSPDGHATAALWSWLLCLVIGWFWVPTFTSAEIEVTLRHANQKAARKAIKGLRRANEMRSTTIEPPERLPRGASEKPVGAIPGPWEVSEEEKKQPVQEDERRAVWEINQNTNPLPNPLHRQSIHPSQPSPEIEKDRDHPGPSTNQDAIGGADHFTRRPIDPENDELLVRQPFDPLNRDAFRHAATFNYSRVIRYLLLVDDVFTVLDGPAHEVTPRLRRTVFPQEALTSMLTASIFALILQCGTTAAATMIAAFTPTIGVGCRSLGYMLYGGLAIVIMFLSIASTIFSRISETRAMSSTITKDFTSFVAIALRRLSLSLAFVNSVALILLWCLQLSGYLDICYCSASVISRGTDSYVIFAYFGWLDETRKYRISSIFLSAVTGAIYMVFLWYKSALPADADHF